MDYIYEKYNIPENERFIAREAYERIRYIKKNFFNLDENIRNKLMKFDENHVFLMMYDFCKRDFQIREASISYSSFMKKNITKKILLEVTNNYINLFEKQKMKRNGDYESPIKCLAQKVIKVNKMRVSRLVKLDLVQEYIFLHHFDFYSEKNFYERHLWDFLSYMCKKLKN